MQYLNEEFFKIFILNKMVNIQCTVLFYTKFSQQHFCDIKSFNKGNPPAKQHFNLRRKYELYRSIFTLKYAFKYSRYLTSLYKKKKS